MTTTARTLINTGVNVLRQDIMFTLTEFLSLHDLSQWDMAFTNTSMRESWLSLDKNVIGTYNFSFTENDDGLQVQWLIKRHILTSGSRLCCEICGPLAPTLTPELIAVFVGQSKIRFLEILHFHSPQHVTKVIDLTTDDVPIDEMSMSFVQRLCDSLASQNRLLAIRILLFGTMGCFSSAQFKVLTKFCPKLVNLEVGLSTGNAIKYLKNCPELRALHLDLSKCTLVNRGMEHLAATCPKLQNLSFSRGSLLTDLDLEVLAGGEACRKLIKLRLPLGCDYRVTATGFAHLIAACRDSLEFIISSLPSSDAIFELLASCPKMRYVEFEEGSWRLIRENDVSDAGLIAFSQSCKFLQVFRLSYPHHFPRLTGNGLVALAKNCTGLLGYGALITNAELIKISKLLPNLIQLTLTRSPIDVQGVCQLAKNCPRLRYVNLEACRRVCDVAFRILLDYCPDIESLMVKGCPKLDNNYRRENQMPLLQTDGGREYLPVFDDDQDDDVELV